MSRYYTEDHEWVEIDNNIVRTTLQAMSAVLGGAQSIHTNSKDEAISLPTDDAAKLALRTQQIIAYESGVINHPDPFGGSETVEKMTEAIIKKTKSIITEIDSIGGAVSAIEQSYMQDQIADSAYNYQKVIDSKEKIIVGINKFRESESLSDKLLKINEKKTYQQIKRIQTIKQSRNNDQVRNRLKDLKKTILAGDNLIPTLIKCVKNDCTLGEISDQMRSVYGEHNGF